MRSFGDEPDMNYIDIGATTKSCFCAILEGDVLRRVRTHGDRLPLSFSQTKYRPSREEARWWRRLPECEKGKENGGAGDRALGRSVIMLVSRQ